jgi:hypothetical protein
VPGADDERTFLSDIFLSYLRLEDHSAVLLLGSRPRLDVLVVPQVLHAVPSAAVALAAVTELHLRMTAIGYAADRATVEIGLRFDADPRRLLTGC